MYDADDFRTDLPAAAGLLVLPRLRVQNANAISSPMTWGFPSMTAFLGVMWALERRLADAYPILFDAVGVVCHGFEPQVATNGYTRAFHLTRNPVGRDGGTAAIVEEGRAHLDLTLIFAVDGEVLTRPRENQDQIAESIAETLATMRIAGGSIVPAPISPRQRPALIALAEDSEERRRQFRTLRRTWLPGFCLVSRDDLLERRLGEIQKENPDATSLDAWLDLSRLNYRAVRQERLDPSTGEMAETVEWQLAQKEGWTVPIPVGYAALSELYEGGAVANARDRTTSFRFVESVYSIGQWIGPHRLTDAGQLLWYARTDLETGLYRCCNDFGATTDTLQD